MPSGSVTSNSGTQISGLLPLPLPATTIHPEGQADAGWESSLKIFNLLTVVLKL